MTESRVLGAESSLLSTQDPQTWDRLRGNTASWWLLMTWLCPRLLMPAISGERFLQKQILTLQMIVADAILSKRILTECLPQDSSCHWDAA